MSLDATYKDIISEYNEDIRQMKKRLESQLLTDLMLSNCLNHQCPQDCANPTALWFLCDISLESVVQKLAHDLTISSDPDSVRAYYCGEALLRSMMNCDQITCLDDRVARTDTEEVSDWEKHAVQFSGARRRKAYWSYLEYQPYNVPRADYQDACGFIEKMSWYCNLEQPEEKDVEAVKQLLLQNKHLASVLDLIKLCLIRKKLCDKRQIESPQN